MSASEDRACPARKGEKACVQKSGDGRCGDLRPQPFLKEAERNEMTKEDIKKLLSEHKDILEKYKVKSISLFGSYTRNEQRKDSDIDFLVEFKEDTYDNFINLVFSLEDLLKKNVTVVSEEDLSPYIKPYVLKEIEKIEG